MPTGFVDRIKGRLMQSSGSYAQFGSGSALMLTGGQLNSTSCASTAGGVSLSTSLVETTLMSYVLPKRSLDRLGRNLLITAFGIFSASTLAARNPASAKLYFGSQTVSIAGTTTVATAQPFWLQLNVFQTSTGSTIGTQTIISQQILSSVHGGVALSTGAEDVTQASTIKFTATSTQAGVAGEVIGMSLQVEGLN